MSVFNAIYPNGPETPLTADDLVRNPSPVHVPNEVATPRVDVKVEIVHKFTLYSTIGLRTQPLVAIPGCTTGEGLRVECRARRPSLRSAIDL
eukprot:9014897-Pyramimonas_sp.AAC.1